MQYNSYDKILNLGKRTNQESVGLRIEQLEAVNSAFHYFTDKKVSGLAKGNSRSFLWNIAVGFGKSICMFELISRLNANKVIIVSSTNAISDNCADYARKRLSEDYAIFVTGGQNFSSETTRFVTFATLPLLRTSKIVGGKSQSPVASELYSTVWDLIIFNDVQDQINTALGQRVAQKLSKNISNVLYVVSSPFNLQTDFGEDQMFSFDYSDIQKLKASTSSGDSDSVNPYIIHPKLNIITFDLSKHFSDNKDANGGFSFTHFFRTTNSSQSLMFENEKDVVRLLDLLCDEEGGGYPFSEKNRSSFNHTLWILPGVKEVNAFSTLLESHPVFSQYSIINTVDEDSLEEKGDLFQYLNDVSSKHKTITVTCGRLTSGIAFPKWSGVFLLKGDNNFPVNSYLQLLSRVLTPNVTDNSYKTNGYLFDFLPDRVLRVVSETSKSSTVHGRDNNISDNDFKSILKCFVLEPNGDCLEQLEPDENALASIDKIVSHGFEDKSLSIDGSEFVSGHWRNGYFKSDGTYVQGTWVNGHFRKYNGSSEIGSGEVGRKNSIHQRVEVMRSTSMIGTVALLYKKYHELDAKPEILRVLDPYIEKTTSYFNIERFNEAYNRVQTLGAYSRTINELFDNIDIEENIESLIFPKEVRELIVRLASFADDADVYLPFTSIKSYYLEAPNCNCFGECKSELGWALNKIVIDANELNTNIVIGDSYDSIFSDKKFDGIITTPPLQKVSSTGSRIVRVDNSQWLVDTVENNLTSSGKMYLLLPVNDCRKNSTNTRKLFDKHYIRSIIQLPKEVINKTNMAWCVFEITPEHNSSVIMFDASDLYTNDNSISRTLSVEKILDYKKHSDDRYCRVVSYEQLSRESTIAPSRFVMNLPNPESGDKTFRLKDLISLCESKLLTNQEGMCLTSKSFSRDYTHCSLDSSSLVQRSNISHVRKINGQCMLLNYSQNEIGVLNLTDNNSDILVPSRGIITFVNKREDLVSDEYLLKLLTSQIVSLQYKALRNSCSSNVGISVDDILSIFLYIPVIREQDKNYALDLKKEIASRDAIIQKQFESYKKDIHMKKHAIGQRLFDLDSWCDELRFRFDESHGLLDLNKKDIDGTDTYYILAKIENIVTTIKAQIESFTNSDKYDDTEEINLEVFINKYISERTNPLFHFDFISQDNKSQSIRFNRKALESIFSNIIHNACYYGFDSKANDGNIIRIWYEVNESDINLYIANNGHPINDKLNNDEVFEYARSSSFGEDGHSGIGCYEVKGLMEKFDGNVELLRSADSDFPVCFKFIFHNTNLL